MQLQPNWQDSPPAPIEWVVWDYTPAEWSAFVTAEGRRVNQTWQRQLRIARIITVILIGLVSLCFFVGWEAPLFFLIIYGSFFGLILLINTIMVHKRALARHNARQRGPAQVRLGPSSITVGTNTTRFAPPADLLVMSMVVARHLYWVRFVAGPPARLVFALTYGRGGPDGLAVPVPADAQDAAIALVARYKREVIRRGPTLSRQPNALPSRPVRPAPLAAALPTDHATQHLPAFDPNPVQSSHPTQRLPRLWVGGTSTAQRYGAGPVLPQEVVAPLTPDSATQRLPSAGGP